MTSGVAVPTLVPGDPGRVRSLAAQLASLAAGLSAAADSVQGAVAHDWQGEAALAFAAAVGATPGPLHAGGEAFGAAAAAVALHAAVLEEAQAMAREAATCTSRLGQRPPCGPRTPTSASGWLGVPPAVTRARRPS